MVDPGDLADVVDVVGQVATVGRRRGRGKRFCSRVDVLEAAAIAAAPPDQVEASRVPVGPVPG